MKHLIFKYISIYVLIGLTSCNSLDLAPEDFFSSENFWNTQSQVNANMNAIHYRLRSRQGTLIHIGEYRSDYYVTGTTSNNIAPMYEAAIISQISPNNPDITWGGFYADILGINNFIDNVENKVSFLSDTDKGYYLGQAYGLRSYYYFLLLKCFGGVPLVTIPKVLHATITDVETLYTPRSTEVETMAFIKEDVIKSLTYFGDNTLIKSNKGQWSKAASLMLKAEVFMWNAKVIAKSNADLAEARAALTEIGTMGFALQNNFADVFDYDNKGNSEIIFAIRNIINESTIIEHARTTSTNLLADFIDANNQALGDTLDLFAGGGTNPTSIAFMEIKFDIWKQFDAADTRRDATLLELYMNEGNLKEGIGGTCQRKFLGKRDALTDIRWFSDDMPIYRYSDYYLMLAEIKNYLGEDPSSEINTIRRRAYGEGFTSYSNAGFAANEIAILDERMKEYVLEGKRWWDLRRMVTDNSEAGEPLALTYVSYIATEPFKLVWPIAISIRSADPTVTQNPGYNESE